MQEMTGNRGYLGKRGSVRESSQRMNTEPRADSIFRQWVQSAHRPVFGAEGMILSSRLTKLE